MREYIYLWVHKYLGLYKDSPNADHHLFENTGIRLSSKYNVKDNFDKNSNKLTIDIESNKPNHNYFSERINDIVAIVGNNSSGKSSILRLLKAILTDGEGNSADDIEYILFYTDGQGIHNKSTLKKKTSVDITMDKNILNKNEINDNYGMTYRSEPHKSDYVIFYSPFFNVSKGLFHENFHGSSNISTENVIDSYSKKLYNPSAGEERFFDRLDSYSLYEQQIELDFMGDFLENEEKLPMDLPTYMHIQSNDHVIILLKEELNKFGNKILLEIIKNWENNANSLRDKIHLSVFACLYRAYNSNSFNPFADRFNSISENPNIKIEDAINTIESGIVSELEVLVDLIEKNSEQKFWDKRYLLFIKSKKEVLKQIMNSHYHIKNDNHLLTPFLLFERQRLSTGEDNFIQFFARFYHIWKDAIIHEGQLGNILEANDIVFLIDEGEANFHPEWQRIYLKTFIEWIELIMKKLENEEKKKIPKFQILLSTHSPFVVCDLPKNNLVCLKLEKKDDFKSVKVVDISTKENLGIGTRIIDLLKNDFFIDSTIGALAKERIEEMVEEIRKKGYKNISDKSKFVFDNLGDQFIKSFLE